MKNKSLMLLSIILVAVLMIQTTICIYAEELSVLKENPTILPANPEDMEIIEAENTATKEAETGIEVNTGGGAAAAAPGMSSNWLLGSTGFSVNLKGIAAVSYSGGSPTNSGIAGSAGGSGMAASSGNQNASVKFAAVGIFGTILTSSDGKRWEVNNSGNTDWLYNITYSNGTFVSVGGTLLYQNADSGIKGLLKELTTGNNPTDLSTGVIMTSRDGKNWTNENSGVTKPIFGIARGKDSFIATGMNGILLTSPDSKKWTIRNSGTIQSLFAAVYAEDTSSGMVNQNSSRIAYVAVGGSGTIITSPDGKVWTSRTSGITDALYCVDYYEGMFVAAGENGSILTSTNGDVWTKRVSGTSKNLIDIGHDSDSFIVVGDSGTVLKSSGGIKWSIQAVGTANDLSSVINYNDSFIAVGEEGIIVNSVKTASQSVSTPTTVDSTNVETPAASTASGETAVSEIEKSLTITPGNGIIMLQWKEAIEKNNLDGYYIYRGNSPGGEASSPLNDFPEQGLSYKDEDVVNGTAYYYIVKPSYNKGKQTGGASNEAYAVPEYGLSADRGSMVLTLGNPNMLVNGKAQEIDPGKGTKPVLKNGKTCVPIRAIIENMGGAVTWNSDEKRIDIVLKDKKLELWIDKTTAKVNGASAKLQLAPYISNTGRTMIPLRFVIENLGCDVEWDSDKQMITINYLYDEKGLEDQQLIDELKDHPIIPKQ